MPVSPVIRAYASAMCTAAASWRTWTRSMPASSAASKTGMMWLPDNVKMRFTPASERAATSASAPRCFESANFDFQAPVSDPATSHLDLDLAAAFGHEGHELLVHVAARPWKEDVGAAVEAEAPAVEMPDLHQRLGGRGKRDAAQLRREAQRLRVRQLLRGRQAVGAEVSAVGDAQLDARQLRAELVLPQHVHRHARDECRHAQERRALRLAHLRQFLVGRVADAHAGIEAAHLDFSQLRVLHLAPLLEHAPLVHFLVPLRERDEILAVEARVDVDERLLLLDADLREEIPELDHVGEAAALVIGVIGEISLQRRLGLVEELVESAHRRITGEFLGPRLDLAKHREVALVHLVVGL